MVRAVRVVRVVRVVLAESPAPMVPMAPMAPMALTVPMALTARRAELSRETLGDRLIEAVEHRCRDQRVRAESFSHRDAGR